MEFRVGTARIRLVQGDITDVEADAKVNAANSSLMVVRAMNDFPAGGDCS